MAVTLTDNTRHYQAVSADQFPSDPPEGSTLHVVDTGEQYVYYDGAWEEDLRLRYAFGTLI